MRFAQYVSVGALLLISTTFAADKKTDFSGSWLFNNQKSSGNENQGRRMKPGNLSVTQNGNQFIIGRTVQRESGDTKTLLDTFSIDGKPTNSISTPDREKKTSVSWNKEGTSIIFSTKAVFERQGAKTEISSTEVWTLSEKGAVLSLVNTSTSPRGERKATFVYDKGK